ncbi:hypothetical protein [Atlantibacter hermannii]|uniref:hypothetical protein n=1 Tax=Atlantibacter hermannii TaxID=565 RepID=UPI0028A8897D|nr:hypothetical protein [Atlantibacter hermannii]
MLTKRDIYSKIEQDLSGPVVELCREVVDFLTSEDARPLKHITYFTLVNGAKNSFAEYEEKILLVKVTDYLSSNRLHLLNMHFQFIESDESEPVPIDDDELSHALHTGEFYHPESGELVENYDHFLFPYFTPSEQLEQIHG